MSGLGPADWRKADTAPTVSPYVPTKIRDTDAEGMWRPEPVQNAYEFAVIGHLRGWCHNGAICLICVTARERDTETMRINEIIGG